MSPLDNDAFPFGTWREIEIGYAVARAHRISYVGELGWELYVPADMARHVFDTLMARGAEVGLRLCGTHALDSCRMEKAYRHYGHDIASTDHVLEAGLGFAVKLDKARGRFGDFLGREGVLQRRAGRPVAPARAVPARRSAAAALRQRGDPARRPRRGLPDVGRLRASSGRRRRSRLRRLRARRERAAPARLRPTRSRWPASRWRPEPASTPLYDPKARAHARVDGSPLENGALRPVDFDAGLGAASLQA